MRILVTTSPLVGHFFPMLPLIRAARTAGHDVVVASGPDLADQVRRRGLEFWQVGPAMADVLAGIRRRPPDPDADRQQALQRDAMDYFGHPGIARARELLPLAAQTRPDLVIHEHTDFAGWEAAAALAVPSLVHGYGPVLPFTAELFRVVCAAAARELDTPDRRAAMAGAIYVDPWPDGLQTDVPVPFGSVVAVRPDPEPLPADQRLPDRIMALPYQATVYATLGTVFSDVGGLTAIIEAARDLAVNMVVTVGPGGDPAAFGDLPAHIAVLPFVPQALLLPHCAAVVSHAGSGTVLGALAARLPQVCLPIGADQWSNATQLARRGAGVLVPTDQRTPESIGSALRAVLGNPTAAAAAGELQDEIEQMPPAEEVLPGLLAD